MYYNQVPMLTHWRHMHDWESFVDAQVTRQEADMTGIWRGNDGGVYYIRHDDPMSGGQASATTVGGNTGHTCFMECGCLMKLDQR
ncbi:hypothetical protein CXF51_01465 [Bacillus subtilis subsp. subtilis]|nr:hypothetical protein CXF51_01465 [Bacillus subtilis subsp. subtilis]